MRKAILFLICGLVVVTLSVNWASARAPYLAEFKAKYAKDDAELAKKVDMVKCNVCHGKNAEGKDDKKVHNDYGKELKKLLKKGDDKDKVQKSLDTVYDIKVPDGTETYGDRIKAHKLPNGD